MSGKFQVVWLKRDLRLQDHEPLSLALDQVAEFGPVLLLYCHEPEMLRRPDSATQHFQFAQECLADIHLALAPHRGVLHVRAGDPAAIFEALHAGGSISRVLAYRETTGPQGFARDLRVLAWAKKAGVAVKELAQNGVRRGSEYARLGFSFEKFANWALNSTLAPWPHPAVLSQAPEALWQPWPLPEEQFRCHPAQLRALCQGADKLARQRGGRAEAQRLRQEFFEEQRLTDYPSSISSPVTAVSGCSRLSPYLAFGVVSVRELIQEVHAFTERKYASLSKDDSLTGPAEGVRFFLERMYWRSSYLQRFELCPQVETDVEHANTRGLREAEFNDRWFEAWQEGKTGFPMVDASMRMLRHTGWLNMRMRGMLISFAANELWLHWREPGLHLAREFLDYEPAIHWHQMQIHSGTCLGEQLTYNPVKQQRDQDPAGRFVRRWVPELAALPTEQLFEPWKAPSAVLAAAKVQLGQQYPAPLVPAVAAHDAARQCVQAAREGRAEPGLSYLRQRRAALEAVRQTSLF